MIILGHYPTYVYLFKSRENVRGLNLGMKGLKLPYFSAIVTGGSVGSEINCKVGVNFFPSVKPSSL